MAEWRISYAVDKIPPGNGKEKNITTKKIQASIENVIIIIIIISIHLYHNIVAPPEGTLGRPQFHSIAFHSLPR